MSTRDWRGRVAAVLILAAIPALTPLLARDVVLLGVFADRALVGVDGQRVVLVVGQAGQEDIRLLSTNTLERRAWLQIDGQRRELAVAARDAGPAGDPASGATRVHRDASGAYTVSGSIGGHAVRFRVDPDAALTLLSASEAERVGVSRGQGRMTTVQTDSGRVFGHRVILPRVQVGGIVLDQVEAVILQDHAPRLPVLATGSLERVQVREEDGTLLLRAAGR